MLAAPGVLLRMSVVRWSSRPEIAKLWLLRSSTSVSALRVESAGTVNPLMETELRVVKRTNFRSHLQPDSSVLVHNGRELHFMP